MKIHMAAVAANQAATQNLIANSNARMMALAPGPPQAEDNGLLSMATFAAPTEAAALAFGSTSVSGTVSVDWDTAIDDIFSNSYVVKNENEEWGSPLEAANAVKALHAQGRIVSGTVGGLDVAHYDRRNNLVTVDIAKIAGQPFPYNNVQQQLPGFLFHEGIHMVDTTGLNPYNQGLRENHAYTGQVNFNAAGMVPYQRPVGR
jgi:hypothetical protein